MNPEEQVRLAEALGVTPGEREVLDAGSSHKSNCRCETCRRWWELVGPDEDGNYGPFSAEEISARN